MHRTLMATLVGTAFAGAGLVGVAHAQTTGPSSSATPYVTPTAAGWSVTSILTVGDSVNNKADGTPYRMVGVPDGLGAYDNKNGTFTVLMNHELGGGLGATRAHGSNGGFVSEWIIRASDLRVLNGADLATSHLVATGAGTWGAATGAANTFSRLCSADLPAETAFYNPLTGRGTQNRIFMNGEETGAEGRAYGFVATGSAKGTAYQLPSLGRFSWENSLANPYSGDKTVVIGTDDSTPGQVYMYVGQKQYTGNEVQRAGLDGGRLYGISVTGKPNEPNNTSPATGAFTLPQINNNAWNSTGASVQAESVAKGVTEFARPEDGHWADARTFYFVTTGATSVQGKLYKVAFTGTAADGSVDYESGGTVSVALNSTGIVGKDGTPIPIAGWDNMTVTRDGLIVLQDDPGNNAYNAKTWLFNPATGAIEQIFESDVARFGRSGANAVGASAPFTVDEENSGVIDITDVLGRGDGKRYLMGVMQAHYGITGELVEGGQLYIMTQVPEPETYALMAGGLAMVAFLARRRQRLQA